MNCNKQQNVRQHSRSRIRPASYMSSKYSNSSFYFLAQVVLSDDIMHLVSTKWSAPILLASKSLTYLSPNPLDQIPHSSLITPIPIRRCGIASIAISRSRVPSIWDRISSVRRWVPSVGNRGVGIGAVGAVASVTLGCGECWHRYDGEQCEEGEFHVVRCVVLFSF